MGNASGDLLSLIQQNLGRLQECLEQSCLISIENLYQRSKTNITIEKSQRVIRKVGSEVITSKKDALDKGVDPGKDLLSLLRPSNYSNSLPHGS